MCLFPSTSPLQPVLPNTEVGGDMQSLREATGGVVLIFVFGNLFFKVFLDVVHIIVSFHR